MILCARIEHFMAVVERRAHPEWSGTPLLFLRYSGKQERVYAVSPEAEGVEVGMRISQAQAICPEGLLLAVTFTHAANALRELVEALREFSERMEVKDDFHEDLVVYLDLGRLKPSDGLRLGERILAVCTEHGFKACIGIAAGKFTAFVAAQRGIVHLVRPGEEAAFLAPLPVTLLPLEREIERSLRQYGIERIGQFAAWSKPAVTAQFGKTGLALLKLAQGQDDRALRLYRFSNREQLLHTFDESPLDSRDLIAWIMDDMIHSLARRLERSASTTEQVTLVLYLERSTSLEAVLEFRQALAGEDELKRVLHRALERMEVAVRVTGLEITCELRVADLPRQLSLFEYAEAQEHQIEQKIKRLAERYGRERFLRVVPDEALPSSSERRFRLEAFNE